MTVFVITCVATLLILAVSRWVLVAQGIVPIRGPESEVKSQGKVVQTPDPEPRPCFSVLPKPFHL
jgi:hypothetical protein